MLRETKVLHLKARSTFRLFTCKSYRHFSAQCPNRLVAFADRQALIGSAGASLQREIVVLEGEQESKDGDNEIISS